MAIRRELAEVRPHAFRPDLAASLNNLANRLIKLHRQEEALNAACEAVEILRQLAGAQPDAFAANLSYSLGVMGSAIADDDGHEDALATFSEGIERLTPYLQQLPAAFSPLMQWLVSSYRDQCTKLEREPKIELLRPVDEILQAIHKKHEGSLLA